MPQGSLLQMGIKLVGSVEGCDQIRTRMPLTQPHTLRTWPSATSVYYSDKQCIKIEIVAEHKGTKQSTHLPQNLLPKSVTDNRREVSSNEDIHLLLVMQMGDAKAYLTKFTRSPTLQTPAT